MGGDEPSTHRALEPMIDVRGDVIEGSSELVGHDGRHRSQVSRQVASTKKGQAIGVEPKPGSLGLI